MKDHTRTPPIRKQTEAERQRAKFARALTKHTFGRFYVDDQMLDEVRRASAPKPTRKS